MGVSSGQVTVGTSATLVYTAGTSGERVHLFDAGGTSVFLGGADVTTANGFELETKTTVLIVLEPGESLYAVVASGTETLGYMNV